VNIKHEYKNEYVIEILDLMESELNHVEDPKHEVEKRKSEESFGLVDPEIGSFFDLILMFKKAMYLLCVNFGMLILTSKHLDTCRYPIHEKNIHPTDYYNSQNYLIQFYTEFVKYHEKSIQFMKELKDFKFS